MLLAIALIIKLTSEGRCCLSKSAWANLVREFKCLKFRTMQLNCESKIHEDYIQQFIAGKGEGARQDSDATVPDRLQDHKRSRA